MKKITFLLVVLVAFCWQANAQLTEGFEAGVPPAGWAIFDNGVGLTNSWEANTTSNTGANAAYVSWENSGSVNEDWLATSLVDLTASTNAQLTFFTRQAFGTDYGSTYEVRVSTATQTTPGDYTGVALWDETTLNTTATVYEEKTVDLSAYDGQMIYVAFVLTNDDGDSWYVDDVSIADAPTCTEAVVNSSTVMPDCGNFQFSVDVDVATVGDGTFITDGLGGSFAVVAGIVTAGPYATGAPVTLTVEHSDAACDFTLGTYGSGACPPTNDTCATAESVTVGDGTCGPTVTGNNIGATDSGEAAPSYGYYSGGDIWYQFVVPAGSTQVNIEIESSAFSTTILAVYNTTMACGSLVEEYSINAYAGSNIAVTGLTAGDTYLLRMYDWSNDDFGDVVFCLSTPPSCLVPTGLNVSNISETSADLGWTEPGTATTWNIEWGASPLTMGTGTMINGTTNNPEPLTGLTPSTAYEFYVQADCGGGDLSAWAGPFAFTTNGPPPANDDCAGAENIVPSTTGAEVWTMGTTANSTASGEISSGDTACFGFGAGREVWYTVEVPAAGDITIETRSVTGSPLTDTVISVFSGTCGAMVGTEIECNDDGGPGNFSLIALTGQTPGAMLYVRVWEYGNPASNGPQDGSFEITAHATDPTLLSIQDFDNGLAFTYYPNPVTNSLTLKAQKNIENVAIYNMLGQEVLRTAPNTVDSEIDMSNLQPGAYFVQVMVENAIKTIKVIKK